MRKKLFGLLAVGAMVLVSSAASAAPVVTAAAIRVSLGALGSFTVPGGGTVSLVGTGSITDGVITGSKVIIPSALVSLPTGTTIIPNSTLVNSIILNQGIRNLSGTLSMGGVTNQASAEVCAGAGTTGAARACVAGGGKGGILPLAGMVTANIGGILAPVNLQGLNIGAGGNVATGLFTGDAAPFTTGTGFAITANLATSTTTLGAGSPSLIFVTPVFLGVPLFGTALALFAEFELTGLSMVPEPGTLLLLGAGVAGLALVGRSRR